MRTFQICVVPLYCLLLASCGGSDDDESPTPLPVTKYTVGGQFNGLNGSIGLQISAAGTVLESKNFSAEGGTTEFSFNTQQNEGISFSISIQTQPSGQNCTVSNGSGNLNSQTATATIVTCTDNAQVSEGVFLDSPVASISYSTASQSGTTDDEGRFSFVEGESVTFTIGALQFPATTAVSVVTPALIAAGDEVLQTNMLQLLQTLDEDGDPSNGIQLRADAVAAFTDSTLDISAESFDTDVAAVLAAIEPTLTLVSEDKALQHFDQSLRQQLIGSWLFEEGEGQRNTLTFIDDKHYIIIHEHTDDGDQTAGSVEYGKYSWDTSTGAFSVSLIGESDASGGLYDQGSGVTKLEVSDTLVISTEDEESIEFVKVDSTTNPLIGAWFLNEPESENISILTILSDTHYSLAHTGNTDSYQGNAQQYSGEFGIYSVQDGVFTVVSASVDSDGPAGLYDDELESQFSDQFQLQPWGDLDIEDSVEEDSFTLVRLGSLAVNLQDFGPERPLGTIVTLRNIYGFTPKELTGKTFRMSVDAAEFPNSNATFELTLSTENTGTIREISEEGSTDLEWQLNDAGSLIATYSDEGDSFVMTLAKLNSDKILLSLRSSDEDSLWETQLKPQDPQIESPLTPAQQLIGSWLYSEGEGKRNILTFIDQEQYVIIHEHDDDSEQSAGSVEHGNYSWNSETGEFSVTLIAESDGSGGLWDDDVGSGISKLTLTQYVKMETSEGDIIEFSRVSHKNNSLSGSWYLKDAQDGNINLLTLLSDTEYVIADTGNQASYSGSPQMLAGEFGTYSLIDGIFSITGASVDTDGPGGFYDATLSEQFSVPIELKPWGELVLDDGEEGTLALIGSFTTDLQDYDATRPLGTLQTIRDLSGFSVEGLTGKTFRMQVDAQEYENNTAIFELVLTTADTGTIKEITEETATAIAWSVNEAGSLVASFTEDEVSFVFTVVPLDTGDDDILLSLRSTDGEDSLWLSDFIIQSTEAR